MERVSTRSLFDAWQIHSRGIWPRMLEVAEESQRSQGGIRTWSNQQRMIEHIAWIQYRVSVLTRIAYSWGAKPKMTPVDAVAAEFVGKLNNLVLPFLVARDDLDHQGNPMINILEPSLVSPLRRIKGSLERAVPHFTASLLDHVPEVVPEHVGYAHRFFDAFIAGAAMLAGPDKPISLAFGANSLPEEMVVFNSDGIMGRHMEGVLDEPRLRSSLAGEMLFCAHKMAPTGPRISIRHGTRSSFIRIPMQIRK